MADLLSFMLVHRQVHKGHLQCVSPPLVGAVLDIEGRRYRVVHVGYRTVRLGIAPTNGLPIHELKGDVIELRDERDPSL